jgi:hypothetical protein
VMVTQRLAKLAVNVAAEIAFLSLGIEHLPDCPSSDHLAQLAA